LISLMVLLQPFKRRPAYRNYENSFMYERRGGKLSSGG